MWSVAILTNNMKKAIIVALLGMVLTSCNYAVVEKDNFLKSAEQAYFEGQRDALSGDIRIKRNADSCYIWVKSPWNGGEEPTFDPSFNCK